MIETFEYLRDYDEDFKSLCLVQSAPLLGVRESRRIVGEYCVTSEDIIKGTRFEDAVATVTFNVDIHGSEGEQVCCDVSAYDIPYRSMLPKGVENLLVAGKTICGSHTAMASYRVTGNCCAMGENAGIAAVYSINNGVALKSVPSDIFVK